MNAFEALILGIVQGLTEFLPISSSGHLVIAETLLDVPTPGIFIEVALHVATLFSVFIVYRGRLTQLVVGAVRLDPDALRYIGLLALATLPAAVVGLLFESSIERAFDTPALTGFALLVTGCFLWSTRFVRHERVQALPRWGLALGIGVAQAFAILPGISRSGATITAGLWGCLAGERAAEFSFLMSIPAIAGAAVLQIGDLDASVGQGGGGALLVGLLAAFLSGILAIRSLVWLIRRQAFHAFAYYVWIVGGAFLIYLWLAG